MNEVWLKLSLLMHATGVLSWMLHSRDLSGLLFLLANDPGG